MHKLLKVQPTDNVAVALVDLSGGDSISFEGQVITIQEDVPRKHKIALERLEAGSEIFMYGVLVGKAQSVIEKGGLLTTQNVEHKVSKTVGKTKQLSWDAPNVDYWADKSFLGYHREDGQVGTKNVWLFFPLVFCENRNIQKLREIFDKELYVEEVSEQQLLLRNLIHGDATTVEQPQARRSIFPNVEVRFIEHQGGCGGIRQDSEVLAKLLAGYVNNPNVAGATVLSLGCQNLQIQIFKDALAAINPNLKKPVLLFEQQQMGTVEEMMNQIIKDSFVAIKEANSQERKPAPLSQLTIGLECGGSDGFSGLSANPTLGYVSDVLAALGGKPILSEFPELCGVEQELVNRCESEEIAHTFLDLMKSYEESAIEAGSGFDMNPSPGNIKDGLITDAMKSAGAAKKGGSSPIVDVLDYAQYVSKPGLNLLCTPGNDVESTTGMVGSGANLVLFTTGLGTPTGNPIAPVIKVSSNSDLAEKMSDIIDFNTGPIIQGEKTIDEMGSELLELIIDVASGKKMAKADQLQQFDFIPWKRGVSL